jgi:hypothetical protein
VKPSIGIPMIGIPMIGIPMIGIPYTDDRYTVHYLLYIPIEIRRSVYR